MQGPQNQQFRQKVYIISRALRPIRHISWLSCSCFFDHVNEHSSSVLHWWPASEKFVARRTCKIRQVMLSHLRTSLCLLTRMGLSLVKRFLIWKSRQTTVRLSQNDDRTTFRLLNVAPERPSKRRYLARQDTQRSLWCFLLPTRVSQATWHCSGSHFWFTRIVCD